MKPFKFLASVLAIFTLVTLVLSSTALAADNSPEPKLQLTQQEQDFIKEHPVIHLGVDPTFVPYEFIDTDGQYKGIAADYIALICEKTGLMMEVKKALLGRKRMKWRFKASLMRCHVLGKPLNESGIFYFRIRILRFNERFLSMKTPRTSAPLRICPVKRLRFR